MAGLAKLILMMQHKQIPPQASLTTLNPSLGLNIADGGDILVPRHLTPWNVPVGAKCLALLNNFGAAGSNVALVLEEPPARLSLPAKSKRRSCHVLTLSAKTAKALDHLRAKFVSLIESRPELDLSSFCYTANARRVEHDAVREAVAANTLGELANQLRQSQATSTPPTKVSGNSCAKSGFHTVFVFSGQGGTHAGMGAELFTTSPSFHKTMLLCDSILSAAGFAKTAPYLTSDDLTYYRSLDSRAQIVLAQCACFVLEYALAQMWTEWGLVPDLVVGHSIGEYAAFAVAGVFSLRDALLLVAGRADLMARHCAASSSGMIACRTSSLHARELIAANILPDLSVACDNSPGDVVVAGRVASLEAFARACQLVGVKTRRLEVPFAYHSAAMDPILEAFQQQVSAIRMEVPTICVGSGLRGEVLPIGLPIKNSYFVEHARDPVRFSELASDIVEKSTHCTESVVLEVGPSAASM